MHMYRPIQRLLAVVVLSVVASALSGCQSDAVATSRGWEGQIDSLPSGVLVVRNDGHGVWPDSGGWTLQEEVRIGSLDAEGPENFGRIVSLAVDGEQRIWVLEGQAAELRVFDKNGAYVRTVGRSGGGPGEFRQPMRVDYGPDGNLWIMDPQNTRLSVFDSAGTYLQGLRTAGGFVIFPWAGGFDRNGTYYAPISLPGDESAPQFGFARFDLSFAPQDTIVPPTDPAERASFTLVSDNGQSRMTASVPFQGGMRTHLSKAGTLWALITDQYRLMEFDANGDTLRVSTKQHAPLAVSAEERAEAIDDLEWFTSQGGRVDESKIPATKPLATSFFVDDAGFVWVAIVGDANANEQRFDLFNPTGQFLGTLTAPFRLLTSPTPIVRDGTLYGVIRDSLDVQYVVRASLRTP